MPDPDNPLGDMPDSRRMPRRLALIFAAMVLMAACGRPSTIEPPEPCNQAVEFAFSGRTTAARLGIAALGDPQAQVVGTAWVTVDKVDWGGGPDNFQRAICMAFDDGTANGQSIEDHWSLPPGADGDLDAPGDGQETGSVLLLGLVVVAVLVSVLAFVGGARDRGSAA